MVLGINSHSVVIAASFDRVRAQHGVSGRIDFGNFVRVSQVDVHPFRDRVVLWHAGFALKREGPNDLVLVYVHDRDCLTQGVRYVHFMKACGVRAPVRLGGRCETFDHTHAFQGHNAKLFFAPISAVESKSDLATVAAVGGVQ